MALHDDSAYLGSLKAPLKERHDALLAALTYARFAALGLLALALLWAEWRHRR